MSFRCAMCKEAQPVNSSPHKIVVETRAVTYPERTKKRVTQFREENIVIDAGGQGTEIVKEIDVCPTCAKKFR